MKKNLSPPDGMGRVFRELLPCALPPDALGMLVCDASSSAC